MAWDCEYALDWEMVGDSAAAMACRDLCDLRSEPRLEKYC
jgi:hypothetical protein